MKQMSRQEYRDSAGDYQSDEQPCLPPVDLLNPGTEPESPAQAGGILYH